MTTRGSIMWVLMILLSVGHIFLSKNFAAAAIWCAASLLVIHMEYLHGR